MSLAIADLMEKKTPQFILTIVFVVVILLIIITASFTSLRHEEAFDAMRTEDMTEISSALALYAKAHEGMFPVSLDSLVANGYLPELPTDPVTGRGYRYLLSGERDFSVCTTFSDGTDHCVSATESDTPTTP